MEAIDGGKISYEDLVPCSENASSMGGSQIWLDTKELLTVNEMLKAICIVSANDCVVAMAEFIAGSQELFVEQMNKRAKELGMEAYAYDENGWPSGFVGGRLLEDIEKLMKVMVILLINV